MHKIGTVQVAEAPRVLAALNPAHAIGAFVAASAASFVVLGTVALAIPGGEALYADMGHFGCFPIRLAWFALVLPTLPRRPLCEIADDLEFLKVQLARIPDSERPGEDALDRKDGDRSSMTNG